MTTDDRHLSTAERQQLIAGQPRWPFPPLDGTLSAALSGPIRCRSTRADVAYPTSRSTRIVNTMIADPTHPLKTGPSSSSPVICTVLATANTVQSMSDGVLAGSAMLLNRRHAGD